MIAPQASIGIDPGHDVLRANQLIEAGLWLHLGGDAAGARSLFVRALSHDPSNRRAREWLTKRDAARAAAPVTAAPPPAVRPMSLTSIPSLASRPARPAVAVAPQPMLEVSVVLLDEEEAEAPRPVAPVVARPVTPAPAALRPAPPVAARPVTPAPVALRPVVAPARMSAPVPQVAPRQGVPTLLVGVEDLLALGDVSSAMELLSKAEQLAPGDARLASARERCGRVQQAALEAKLGNLKRVPTLKLRMADLMKLRLDPRAGFLLSRIDGSLSFEALFSVSGMSRLDTLRVLAQLLDQDIIAVR